MDSKRKFESGKHSDATSPSKACKKHLVNLKYVDAGAVQAAFENNVISQWEHNFYTDILGKEELSSKQAHYKDLVEFKISTHAAKEKAAITEFEFKFAVDNFGKADEVLSEKQRPIKQRIDAKLTVWRAFQLNAINDWDLKFMISNSDREAWSAKQLPIKERIERQMKATSAIEAYMLSDWEIKFFKDIAAKDPSTLSEKQRPFMDKIQKKLKVWTAYKAGVLDAWQLDFYKDAAGKEKLSEKQVAKLREIEEKLIDGS